MEAKAQNNNKVILKLYFTKEKNERGSMETTRYGLDASFRKDTSYSSVAEALAIRQALILFRDGNDWILLQRREGVEMTTGGQEEEGDLVAEHIDAGAWSFEDAAVDQSFALPGWLRESCCNGGRRARGEGNVGLNSGSGWGLRASVYLGLV
ncbi:uncharacterized protein DS421_16g561570 [Arachis hypogaea]|nr:uncharacterized protein DS421_16g561570 [Arachis hypogaea]